MDNREMVSMAVAIDDTCVAVGIRDLIDKLEAELSKGYEIVAFSGTIASMDGTALEEYYDFDNYPDDAAEPDDEELCIDLGDWEEEDYDLEDCPF